MSDHSVSSQAYRSQEMDVKCCPHQHEVLVTYIRYALQCWGPLDDLSMSYWIDGIVTPWKRSSPIQATPELKRVLTRARILSEDCCTELPPLRAVLWHADRSQAFADIVKEIQWCTSVVYNDTICRNLTGRSAPELKDFPWQAKIGNQEKLLLEKAEQKDWQQLMQELAKYDGHRHCSAEDCGNIHGQMDPSYCVTAQAMQRFFPQETGGSEPHHKSLLWSFDPEVVKHGRLLGSGSFGYVTEVTWLGFKYAQKIFSVAGLHSLPAEIEALVKLNHPHIVKLYAYSEDSLLMDLMCTDLDKFMKNRMKGGARIEPFSLPAAMDLMLQIADAVSYLHSQGIAHRDLKSSNILVNPVNTSDLDEDDGYVFAKIADFGLAKTKRDITRYSHLTHNIATRKWMAPEIFGANVEDDHLEHAFPMKADVYSFGLICFAILSGEEPFSDEPLTTLYSKLTAPIIPLRPQLPSSCPANLASLIHACWDSDPRKRPTFGDVCRVLRYINSLPTLIALNDAIDGEWPFGRLTSIFETQGPWGASGKPQENWIVGTVDPLVDIRGVKILFRDLFQRKLSGFNYHIRGHQFERCIGRGSRGSSGWIYFEENEFLVQVEGSISMAPSGHVKSLSFITTRRKYGPYGTFKGKTKSYSTNRGKVVGFTGVTDSSNKLLVLEVHTIPDKLLSIEVDTMRPNIVECLRHYLENEESII